MLNARPRLILLVVTLGPISSFAFGQASLSHEMNKPDKAVVGLPYSADMSVRTVQHLASGVTITRQLVGHAYRSSTGVERLEGDFVWNDPAQKHPAGQTLILDHPRRVVWMLHAGTVSSLPIQANAAVSGSLLSLPGDSVPEAMRPGKSVTADLGSRVQDGLNLVGRRTTRTIPFDGMGNDVPFLATTETWRSSELSLVVSKIEHDPTEGDLDLELTNIRREEPDAALFVVPEGYRVIVLPLPDAAR